MSRRARAEPTQLLLLAHRVGVLPIAVGTGVSRNEAQGDEGGDRHHRDEQGDAEDARPADVMQPLDAERDVRPDRDHDRDPERRFPHLAGGAVFRGSVKR